MCPLVNTRQTLNDLLPDEQLRPHLENGDSLLSSWAKSWVRWNARLSALALPTPTSYL
jgi:hypothetical protein